MGGVVFTRCRFSVIWSCVTCVLVGLSGGVACAADPEPASDGESNFSFLTGFDYTAGNYGTSQTTKLLSVPFSLRYDADKFSVDATLPFLQQIGPTGQTIVGGRIIPTGAPVGGRATPRIATITGWGDFVLGATRYFDGESDTSPVFSLRGQVKFGTANSDVGLGTGKNDYTVQGGVMKPLGKLLLGGNLGYTKFGSPTGVTLKGGWSASLDGGYRIAEKSKIGISGYIAQTNLQGTQGPFDATIYYAYSPSKTVQLRAYFLKGLSDGSANHGLGASAFVLF